MRRRQADLSKERGCASCVILLAIALGSCLLGYVVLSPIVFYSRADNRSSVTSKIDRSACCRGVEHVEFWGRVVTWGDKHITNSSEHCCSRCKALCPGNGLCQCNSWVYCADKAKCGKDFGQCWLKKQDDPLAPDIQESGSHVKWTSGLIFGKDDGILGIETKLGTIRIKLLVDCAPHSVAYILELKTLRHCAGCHLYRVEGRGDIWDDEGNRISQTTSKTSPYGLIQGTLAAETIPFKELPRESCPVIQRGSVGWIKGGPDFFISLANHDEWYPKHTVFAHVLPEDMDIVEKLANLPAHSAIWSDVKVALLQAVLPIRIVELGSPTVAEVSSG